ncbi:MAG: hypothetical protein NTU53_02700 [Planctomycetota bacterium]|nr:hypothetical protein [Planctomycetota bacterium]
MSALTDRQQARERLSQLIQSILFYDAVVTAGFSIRASLTCEFLEVDPGLGVSYDPAPRLNSFVANLDCVNFHTAVPDPSTLHVLLIALLGLLPRCRPRQKSIFDFRSPKRTQPSNDLDRIPQDLLTAP